MKKVRPPFSPIPCTIRKTQTLSAFTQWIEPSIYLPPNDPPISFFSVCKDHYQIVSSKEPKTVSKVFDLTTYFQLRVFCFCFCFVFWKFVYVFVEMYIFYEVSYSNTILFEHSMSPQDPYLSYIQWLMSIMFKIGYPIPLPPVMFYILRHSKIRIWKPVSQKES